jgi:hypothetical protein
MGSDSINFDLIQQTAPGKPGGGFFMPPINCDANRGNISLPCAQAKR